MSSFCLKYLQLVSADSDVVRSNIRVCTMKFTMCHLSVLELALAIDTNASTVFEDALQRDTFPLGSAN